VRVTVGAFDLAFATANLRGLTEKLRQLPARYADISNGDYSWLAAQALAQRRAESSNAQSPIIDCADGVSAERRARAERERTSSILGIALDLPWPDNCPAWGVPDLGPENRAPVRSRVRVLLISGELDGLTPPANALETLATLPNGRHLLIKGVAHGEYDALINSPEVLPLVFEFIRTGAISKDSVVIPFTLERPRRAARQ
jgi:pimeloyl-ACP methyl ester carboxylesterase